MHGEGHHTNTSVLLRFMHVFGPNKSNSMLLWKCHPCVESVSQINRACLFHPSISTLYNLIKFPHCKAQRLVGSGKLRTEAHFFSYI